MKLLLLAILALQPIAALSQETCKAPAPVEHAAEPALHAENCAPLTFSHYPPTTGRHYGTWARFQSYDMVLSPGFWLHSAEHGAVIFLVNCHTPGDCHEDIARLKSIAAAFPVDPLCDSIVKRRIIIAGDTTMDTRFAAVAWGWSLKSDCLDSAAFAAFLKDHYAKTEEDFCLGGTDFPGTGWCNAPLGLEDGKNGPGKTGYGGAGRAKGGSNAGRVLWEGNLAAQGRLSADLISMDGKVLATVDLGKAGPGPARAIWDEAGFTGSLKGAKAAVCRVGISTPAGRRILAESVILP